MTTMLKQALALAARGFQVFPLVPGGKTPMIKEWQHRATTEVEQIEEWWGGSRKPNIGICTTRYCSNKALVVIDVDDKGDKRGSEELLKLELDGRDFPATLEVRTPSGGRHLYYVHDHPVRQGTNVLGPGLDIRSDGGFVVAPGSEVDIGTYVFEDDTQEPSSAPTWLSDFCGRRGERSFEMDVAAVPNVNQDRAAARVVEYLQARAPLANQGDGGDETTFKVAAMAKDFGVPESTCLDLMAEHWNDRCSPPWDLQDLKEKVRNAYAYSQEPVGSKAPEAGFEPVPIDHESLSPVDRINTQYCLIKKGVYILHETTDHKGRFVVEVLTPTQLNILYANQPVQVGKSSKPASILWLESPTRREYDGVVFMPEKDLGPRWLNLWRGFRVKPADDSNHFAVDMLLEHARENVCGGNEELFRWLMGYFAHMIQRPSEKPQVALVFRGRKGTGKNAIVERIGHLLGHHFMVVDSPRYLVGTFNAHFESCMFIVLNEAHWAGDKTTEGRLKGLVTESEHFIERKGKEVYRVDNLCRVALIGNEDWLVPATEDERRWAVFDVGDGRRLDKKFFVDMKEGLENGGASHLLRYLLDYDLTGIDVDFAPQTAALADQKTASLEVVHQWWLDCLTEGRIVGGDVDGWSETVGTDRFRGAFRRYYKERNVRARIPDDRTFGKELQKCIPSLQRSRSRKEGQLGYSYQLPSLEGARSAWDSFIGHKVDWS